ncbi:MAG: hypothetical protein J6B98_02120 [Bacilli bacterium]|nr:hypothetical protein [Bacilli bacterium]
MKKNLKIILIILGTIIGIILLDSIQAFVFDNNPIIKIKEYYDGGDIKYKSKGILVDTVNCVNGIRDTQIKGFSHSCNYMGGNYILVDKTKETKDFSCAEALEEFYEDDTYIYYWNCIKNKYMVVKYDNGTEETISQALLKGHIDIQILDKFNISYIKEEKVPTITKKIEVIKPEIHNAVLFNKYLERDNRTFYLAGHIEEIYYTDSETRMSLKNYISKSYQTLDDSIKHLTDIMDYVDTLNDGGTTIYKSNAYDITIIKCNTLSGNRDVFIGDYTMNFDNESLCK